MDVTRASLDRTWQADWLEALGPFWHAQLIFFAVCLFMAGASFPLADPDLPIHLATGEWVARHHAVPFFEPWAWTRAGQPFQAYSWAIETTYYVVITHFGPAGLRCLQGLIYVALGCSIFVLGVAAQWRAWTVLVVVAVQLIVAVGVTPFLRPQSILLVMTPLIWALVLRGRDVERLRWELPALIAASAVVANTHLLFPITIAPTVLLVARPPAARGRLVLIPAAIVLGWFLTPYALHWVEIFRLNFAPNPMIGPPSPIAEYKPGFSTAATAGISSLYVTAAFLFLPWVVASRCTAIERTLYGVLWVGGLALFAAAVRALIVWWLLIIPPFAIAIELLPPPRLPALRTAQRGALIVIFCAVAMLGVEDFYDPWMRAGDATTRVLPSLNARAIEPIARWLDCNVKVGAQGKLVTTFNFGGYIPWRLPYLSESVDGRTFFPDSVAKAETYFPPTKAAIPLPPWRTADLAIAPLHVPLGPVLDTATGWRRVAITSELEGPASMIGLWVKDSWWASAGRSSVPSGMIPLLHHPLSSSELSHGARCGQSAAPRGLTGELAVPLVHQGR